MATADEIFAEAGSEVYNEGHIVIGRDRFIVMPETLKRLAVQYDHNIETVTFDCPRYWDDHDMSKMSIYVNYITANGKSGVYPAENIRVDDVDDSIMHFEWTISRNVTETAGKLTYLVCIKKANSEGIEQNHWNSEICTDAYVSKGLETGDDIGLDYLMPDVVERWHAEVTSRFNDVETEINTRVDDKIAELQNVASEVTEQVNSKIAEIDTLGANLTEQVSNKITEIDTLGNNLTEQVSTKITEVEQVTTELTTQVTNKTEELTNTVDSKIAELTDAVDNKSAELTEKVDTKITELANAFDEKSAELTQNVNEAIQNLTDTVNETVDSANKAVETVTNDLLAAKEAGEFNGATFLPSLSQTGDLSWTNDKGLTNPETVNIKGNRGDDGISPTVAITPIQNGHRITITDVNGTQSIDVKNGIVEFTGTEMIDEYMKKYVFIGDTEPTSGPVLWFDTSVQSLVENIIMLQLAEFTDDTPVSATIDETEYSVTNASEPTETAVKDTYAIHIS